MSRPRPDYLNIVGVPQHPQHQGGALPSEQGEPDMTMPTSDSEYAREAQRDREQDLELARIAADERVKLADIRARQADERRPYIGGTLACLAALLCVVSIIAAIVWNTNASRVALRHAQDRQAEVARECILAGNIWANGDCLITRKAG